MSLMGYGSYREINMLNTNTDRNHASKVAKGLVPNFVPSHRAQQRGRNTPAIEGKWLNDAHEVFSYLQYHEVEKENWWKTMSATLNLLKQSRHMIEQSREHIAIQNQRIQELERLSTTDELTKITNRRGFMENFNRELDRVNRDKSQGGLLIMIDLDNFKMINDSYSHQAGDAALKMVAHTLTNDIRAMDIAGRLGGDEFVLLFVNTARKEALERAQGLIKKLNNLSFIWLAEKWNISVTLLGELIYNHCKRLEKEPIVNHNYRE